MDKNSYIINQKRTAFLEGGKGDSLVHRSLQGGPLLFGGA